jgi:membrane complex biogenesis BtpA family protein
MGTAQRCRISNAMRAMAASVAAKARIAFEIRQRCAVPIGINVLRNDGASALAVAVASGADFIRVNVLTGARVTDQGLIQGIAHDVLRARAQLNAQHVRILADVDVKHSAPLAPRPLGDEARDTLERGLADALVVSGSGTGEPVASDKVATVKEAVGGRLVLIGSGVTPATLPELARRADGFIVGTALKRDGRVDHEVDPARVRVLMAAHAALRQRA